MANKERDILDDLFRLKLQDIEAGTAPEDWEAIAGRLPESRPVPFRRPRMYWAAAALAALVVGGGSIYLSRQTNTNTFPAKTIVHDVPERKTTLETPARPVAPAHASSFIARAGQAPRQPAAASPTFDSAQAEEDGSKAGTDREEPAIQEAEKNRKEIPATTDRALIAGAEPIQEEKRNASSQKWGFGMGMGGLTQSSGEVVNTYVLRSSNNLEDEELLALNAAPDQNMGKLPRTNIKHKTPVAFGLSVSRALSNRLSLHTGLVYSLLISDWETQASAYNTKTRQTLHFIGLPLSLSYRIAEWKRFQLYVSTGVQTEVNLAGRLRIKQFSDDLQTGVSYTNQRMKEWQWSVNARAGISYPLIPYIQAFAEIGTAYYFDNGSETKTIYSDKAFNISPQLGLRLSF